VEVHSARRRAAVAAAMRHLTHGAPGGSNERLEARRFQFSNCSVARCCTTPSGCREGALSRLRGRRQPAGNLAQVAQQLGLGEHLRMGQGERKSGRIRGADRFMADTWRPIWSDFSRLRIRFGGQQWSQRILGQRISRCRPPTLPEGPQDAATEALQAQGLACKSTPEPGNRRTPTPILNGDAPVPMFEWRRWARAGRRRRGRTIGGGAALGRFARRDTAAGRSASRHA